MGYDVFNYAVQVAIARGNEVFDDLLAKAAADMVQALAIDDDE